MTADEIARRTQALAGLGSWKLRRRMMFGTVGFCMVTVWAVLLLRLDSRVAESAVNGCLLLIGAVVPVYVFGAAWEDIRTKQMVIAAPADPVEPPKE
jgi:hypothetical protein